jgi:septum formation protein
MLQALAGRTHTVVSGLALVRDGVPTVVHAETRVTFRTVEERVLRWYVGTGEWQGRAGAYAIQGRGAALVARIEGDYLNVVGLPVAALLDIAPDLLGAAR